MNVFVNMYYNYEGTESCLDLWPDTGDAPATDPMAWDAFYCNEFPQPFA